MENHLIWLSSHSPVISNGNLWMVLLPSNTYLHRQQCDPALNCRSHTTVRKCVLLHRGTDHNSILGFLFMLLTKGKDYSSFD